MTKEVEGQTLPEMVVDSTAGPLQIPGDLKGGWTVLYTYPKDDTPGCTKEACSFRDNKAEFERIGARVFGISLDDIASHQAFIDKYDLNFPLLADPGAVLANALGSFGDQEYKGQVYKGLSRDTFIIDAQGVVRKVWRKADPTTTMSEAREEIKRLQAS
jgi:thioredoxin-dependent peroxiredoxin